MYSAPPSILGFGQVMLAFEALLGRPNPTAKSLAMLVSWMRGFSVLHR